MTVMFDATIIWVCPELQKELLIIFSISSSIDNYGPFFSLDVILSNMDDENFGIKNSNTLDRIAHAIHMNHMWEQAAQLYKVGCN